MAVVMAAIVVVAVVVVLAIGIIVLLVIGDQIVQREAVMGGDEVDAREGSAFFGEHVGAARDAPGEKRFCRQVPPDWQAGWSRDGAGSSQMYGLA